MAEIKKGMIVKVKDIERQGRMLVTEGDKEIAEMLDGIEYGLEIRTDIIKYAKENGFVIVFGASDDLMEFRGAIDSEISCYEGTTVWLNQDSILQNECYDDRCPYFKRKVSEANFYITALWHDEGEYSWTYNTNIKHETFNIMEEGKRYCRGIVFLKEE